MSKTIRSSIILCLLLCTCTITNSIGQSSVGVGFGYSIYRGDLSHPSILSDFKQAGRAFNIYYKLQLQKSIRARLGFYSGQVSGDDSTSSNLIQQRRNLSFRNNITELSLAGEYNFSNRYIGGSPISLYALGGVAIYRSQPTTEYNGVEYSLRELSTENQSTPYALYYPSLMLGGGLELELNDAISVAFEVIGRVSNNDYLDDVSGNYPDYNLTLEQQGPLSAFLSDRRDEFLGLAEGTSDIPGVGNKRGSPTSKDFYITAIINLLIRINPNDYVGKNRKRIICPSAN